MPELVLHDYWRSGAAYRLRIALNLKGLAYRSLPHDLRIGEQREPAFQAIAPQGLVPAIEYGETTLTQSMAIMEWLEDKWPAPALLPDDPDGRAVVRAMSQLIACDIHPLNNLRVLTYLGTELDIPEDARNEWIARWIADGFEALERLVVRYGSGFSYGDTPSMADCCLIPQIYSARRFGVDLSPYPRLTEIETATQVIKAFARAHPAVQDGAA